MLHSLERRCKTTRIVLVTPIYKTPLPFFKNCLHSVMPLINSNLHHIEIIWVLVIDGDKRPIEEFVEREYYGLYKTVPQIVRLEKNLGLGAAKNRICKCLDTDYFGWIDADDSLIATEYIKFIDVSIRLSRKNGSDMLYFTDSYDCNENLRILHRRNKKFLWLNHVEFKGTKNDPIAFVDFIYQCQLVNAQALTKVGGFTENILGEDVDLLLKIVRLNEKPNIVHFPFAPYLYRLNKNGICESRWHELCASMEKIYHQHAIFWANDNLVFRHAGNYRLTSKTELKLSKQENISSINTSLFDVYLPITSIKNLWPDFIVD